MVKKSGGKAAKRSQSPSRRWSTNAALQAKLAQLSALAAEGNREAFARAFVPLDLTEDELMGYASDLRTNEDQWVHLVSDISTIVGGVERIEGDQVTKATFYFAHAMVEGCDRVVTFINVNDEWRAEG